MITKRFLLRCAGACDCLKNDLTLTERGKPGSSSPEFIFSHRSWVLWSWKKPKLNVTFQINRLRPRDIVWCTLICRATSGQSWYWPMHFQGSWWQGYKVRLKLILFCLFWNRISPCYPGWPQTPCSSDPSLSLRVFPGSQPLFSLSLCSESSRYHIPPLLSFSTKFLCSLHPLFIPWFWFCFSQKSGFPI